LAGYTDKVRVEVAGDAVTLTGTLTAEEHARLLRRLRGMPAKIRLNDRIQVAGAASAEEEEKPRTAPGMGEIEVLTDVLGARAVLRGPQDKTVLDCRTPCRFEDLPPGRYTMEITKDGYRTVRRILQVRAGSILEEKITLQPLPEGSM